jgi:hypothetical protein
MYSPGNRHAKPFFKLKVRELNEREHYKRDGTLWRTIEYRLGWSSPIK